MEGARSVQRKQINAIHTKNYKFSKIEAIHTTCSAKSKMKTNTFSKQNFVLYLTTSKCGVEDPTYTCRYRHLSPMVIPMISYVLVVGFNYNLVMYIIIVVFASSRTSNCPEYHIISIIREEEQ